MKDIEELVGFFVEVNSLKRTLRYSSCPKRIQEPTAGHTWMVTLMGSTIANEFNLDVDIQHAMEIAVVHDLAEYVGEYDYDSFLIAKGELSQEDKDASEEKVMSLIKERFSFGKRIYDLWQEYEEGKTREAKYVRALDKLESDIHIIDLEGTEESINDAEHQVFYADEAVKNFPELKPFLSSIKKRLRPYLENQGLVWKEEYNWPD